MLLVYLVFKTLGQIYKEVKYFISMVLRVMEEERGV